MKAIRTENEIIQLIIDQVIHWVRRCGRDESNLADMVLEAEDMIMTDDEAMAYPRIGEHTKMHIVL